MRNFRFPPSRFASAGFLLLSVLVYLVAASPVQFVDIARSAGLNDVFYCGNDAGKKYIIETLGGGVALFDYDNDGYLDAFFVTGSVLEGFPPGAAPTNQLYRNNHDGTFTKVTVPSRLAESGWGQGVCVGDYDNDGFDDLFVTYYGHNH